MIAPWLLPVLRDLDLDFDLDTEWIAAQRLSDGADMLLPIDLCLRRPEARRVFQLPGRLALAAPRVCRRRARC